MTDDAPERADVVVVGGGPAGCAAAVFAARYDLDTVVFDRGRSSIARCGFLHNYLGFPAGIDIETFTDLAHDHVREVGGRVVDDLVEHVEKDGDGFVVETQDGRSVEASRVVAATKFGADYLDGFAECFHTVEYGGETQAELDPDVVDAEGRTPITGLYVAGPLGGCTDQALVAAGDGAAAGVALVEDVRRARGYWDGVAGYYDWVRREAELSGEWAERDHWESYVEEHMTPEERPADFERVRDAYIDERFAQYVSEAERDRRRERAHETLVAHLDEPSE